MYFKTQNSKKKKKTRSDENVFFILFLNCCDKQFHVALHQKVNVFDSFWRITHLWEKKIDVEGRKHAAIADDPLKRTFPCCLGNLSANC